MVGCVVFILIKNFFGVEKVTCSNEPCIRFCCISKCNESQSNITFLEEAKELKNETITSIDGRLCSKKKQTNVAWEFEKYFFYDLLNNKKVF